MYNRQDVTSLVLLSSSISGCDTILVYIKQEYIAICKIRISLNTTKYDGVFEIRLQIFQVVLVISPFKMLNGQKATLTEM